MSTLKQVVLAAGAGAVALTLCVAPVQAETNRGSKRTLVQEKEAKPSTEELRKQAQDKAWGFLKTMYNQPAPRDDRMQIKSGWGPKSMNTPYTALVLQSILGTDVWSDDDAMIKDSVTWLVENQEPTGDWSFMPGVPQARGMYAVYVTSIVAQLFADLNADGAWKGKLNDSVAKARDYLKQSQVGGPDGPAADYEESKPGYGGWAYSKEEIGQGKKPASNMSTSSFAVDALHACGVKEDDELWQRALVFFKRNQNAGEVQDEGWQGTDSKGRKVKPAGKDSPDYGGASYSEGSSSGEEENEDGTVTFASYGTMTYNLLRAYLFAGLKKDSVPVKLAMGWIQKNYTVERVPGLRDEKDFAKGLYYYYMSMGKTLNSIRKGTAMKRMKITSMLALSAAFTISFAACGGGNNAATPPAGNTPAGNTGGGNAGDSASTDGGGDTTDKPPASFDLNAEREAVVAKAWKYLDGMYQSKDDSMDENNVGIPGGWGKNSTNIPYTAMVLDAIIGTKAWDAANPKIKDSVDWLATVQEPGGGWSYAPADVLPQAKGVRAVYITGIVASLFSELNKMDGPWKGKLNDNIAKAVDYLKQSQVGNPDGPAADYDKNKTGYGGWAYSKEEIDTGVLDKKPASNMSTSTYAIDALHDCGVDKGDPLWEDALTFLKRNQNAGEVQDEGFEAMINGKKLKVAEKGDPNYGGSIYSEETSKPGMRENEDGTVTLLSYGTMTYNLLRCYLFAGLKKDSLPVKLAWGWIQRNYTVKGVPGWQAGKDDNGLYYYYLSMGKTLNALGVDVVEEEERGLKHNWREDLVKELKSRQKDDGSWVNSNPHWQEDSPVLCTCYALGAMKSTK